MVSVRRSSLQPELVRSSEPGCIAVYELIWEGALSDRSFTCQSRDWAGMTDDDGGSALPPDQAFAALGNETRIEILRALGEVDEPLSFSNLHDRVEMRDSSQFNYHLEKLVGHFVRKSEAGYALTRAGRRVIEAVLSGAVTEAPVVDRTEVDHPCHLCGAPIEVTFHEERVELYCTACSGTYTRSSSTGDRTHAADYGYLGYQPLPPAGVRGRSPHELLQASYTWGTLELMAASHGMCPRCSASLEQSTDVCRDHDASDGLCETCGRRYAVGIQLECTNCIYDEGAAAAVGLTGSTPVLAFLLEHDVNPIHPTPDLLPTATQAINDYREEILATDPLRARFTFTIGDDDLTVTVDENLAVESWT